MDKSTCCAFTGYRPEKFPFPFDTACAEYRAFENALTTSIIAANAAGYRTFYSGVARGFDLLAAELVLMLRESGKPLSLCCVLPFRDQCHGWPLDWQQRYLRVLKAADEVIVLSDAYSRGVYQKRNRYMIEHAAAVITYFDGQKGGTASTVQMAQRRGLTVINLADNYRQLTLFE